MLSFFFDCLPPSSSIVSLLWTWFGAGVCLIPDARTHAFVTQYANKYSTPAHLGMSIAIGITVSAATGYHGMGILYTALYASMIDSVIIVIM